ncbi:hypothetical protein J6590_066454 [Homalodisca vitripennis]|nr:hypothetical protein J6590_066454 [Homalodisca vitripennis]
MRMQREYRRMNQFDVTTPHLDWWLRLNTYELTGSETSGKHIIQLVYMMVNGAQDLTEGPVQWVLQIACRRWNADAAWCLAKSRSTKSRRNGVDKSGERKRALEPWQVGEYQNLDQGHVLYSVAIGYCNVPHLGLYTSFFE